MKRAFLIGVLAAVLGLTSSAAVTAQSTTTSLGSVTLKKGVMADGKPLAAGTYVVRLTTDEAKPATGQSQFEPEKVRAAKIIEIDVIDRR